LVQCDSGVEDAFISRLRDDPHVELYFKFPPAFKVELPRIVGNYNPDWGIVRREEDGKVTLHLVRETKGAEDIKALRFSHEKRKIVCAKKYFEMAGVDYRVITEKTPEWWKPVESVQEQLDIEGGR
jgi:type III restriction enzyme